MKLVDKITELTGKTYIILRHFQWQFSRWVLVSGGGGVGGGGGGTMKWSPYSIDSRYIQGILMGVESSAGRMGGGGRVTKSFF